MKNLFLVIGAPGSGKTTDVSLIAKNNKDISHYSTGDLLRKQIESGSDLGKIIENFTSKGNLVPLDIVIRTIVEAIRSSKNNIVIIDGYPRSVEQMMELDKFLRNEKYIKLLSVIEVEVSEEVAKQRVLGRARGADDNEEVFKNRMKVYTQPLKDIQDFYSKTNLLKKVDGCRTIEEIVKEMQEHIRSCI